MLKYSLSCVKTYVSERARMHMHGHEGHNPWHIIIKTMQKYYLLVARSERIILQFQI